MARHTFYTDDPHRHVFENEQDQHYTFWNENPPKRKPKLPLGWVILESVDPPLRIRTPMDDQEPILSEGYGGWQQVDRPQRIQASVWTGRPLFKLVFGVVFNRWSDKDHSAHVENEIARLEAMCRKAPKHAEPPLIIIDGHGSIPRDVKNWPNTWWVLNDIQPTEQLWNPHGRRNRFVATLTFLEWRGTESIPDPSEARKRQEQARKKKGARRKWYTVRDGDTLQKIAARELHSRSRWKEIARLNNLRDGRRIHPGARILLP